MPLHTKRKGEFLATPDPPGISSRFKDLLELMGLKPRPAAKELGCHFTQVYKWLRVDVVPDGATLKRLNDLGWSADWLLGGQGAPRLQAGADERYEAGVRAGMARALGAVVREGETVGAYEKASPAKPSGEAAVVGELVEKVEKKRGAPARKRSQTPSAKAPRQSRK